MKNLSPTSKKMIWTGRIISILLILFLLLDAVMKVIKAAPSMEGSVQLGWPQQSVQAIGIVLFLCCMIYAIPRTAFFGAILLTGYLGGATAIMVRSGIDGHPFIFPVVFGILIWVSLYLRNANFRSVMLRS